MSAVLDTHIVLWYLENSQELSSVARTAIEDAVRIAMCMYRPSHSSRPFTWSKGEGFRSLP
jgi:hypothetical protein